MPSRHLSLQPPTAGQHLRSTLALCLAVLSVSYALISVFPYSGYMTIQLRQDAVLNEENVGLYAGLLASSFLTGRALSSYYCALWWEQAADRYGRVPCLSGCLMLSSWLALAFGVSTSYGLALTWRFLLGLSHGGILPIAKTAVSELALGDKTLETRGMGRLMSMWGWGFFLAPAVSGVLADPRKQYPNAGWAREGALSDLLAKFPFCLPNFVGAALGFAALIAVNVWVEETLPQRKVRSLSHVPSDIWTTVRRVLSIIPEGDDAEEEPERTPLRSSSSKRGSSNLHYGSRTAVVEEEGALDESDDEAYDLGLQLLEDDVAGAVREAQAAYDESVVLLSTSGPPARQALEQAVTARCSSSHTVHRQRISRLSMASASRPAPATMMSLWCQTSTRRHMVLYWVSSFVMVAINEGFPLFCISRAAGLGLWEKSIGTILSASGLIFALAQYVVYASLVQWLGLYGSIRIGALAMGPMIALIPLSLWLDQRTEMGSDDVERDSLTLSAFLYLSGLLAVYRVFGLALFSSLTVALNRTVLPSHRATMNGLSAVGGSTAKALGPTFSGALVAFSFSSGVFSPHAGAMFMFLVLAAMGTIVVVLSFVLIHDDSEDESNAELNV